MGDSSERIRMRTLFLLSALSSAIAAPFSGSVSGSSMRSGSAPDYSGSDYGPDYGSYGSGSMRSGSAPDYSGSDYGPDYSYGSGSMRSGSAPDYSGSDYGPDSLMDLDQ